MKKAIRRWLSWFTWLGSYIYGLFWAPLYREVVFLVGIFGS